MAIQAQVIKKGKQGGGTIGKILGTVAGGAAGFLLGGPAGAVTGANMGGGLGGAAGQALNPGQAEQNQTIGMGESAMGRRLANLKGDNLVALRDAAINLPQLPRDLQEQYAQPIFEAYQQAMQKRNA